VRLVREAVARHQVTITQPPTESATALIVLDLAVPHRRNADFQLGDAERRQGAGNRDFFASGKDNAGRLSPSLSVMSMSETGREVMSIINSQHYAIDLDNGVGGFASRQPQVFDRRFGDLRGDFKAVANVKDDVGIDGAGRDFLDGSFEDVACADFHKWVPSC